MFFVEVKAKKIQKQITKKTLVCVVFEVTKSPQNKKKHYKVCEIHSRIEIPESPKTSSMIVSLHCSFVLFLAHEIPGVKFHRRLQLRDPCGRETLLMPLFQVLAPFTLEKEITSARHIYDANPNNAICGEIPQKSPYIPTNRVN